MANVKLIFKEELLTNNCNESNTVYFTTESVNYATNCSFFLMLSLSTQHVSALNGHLHVSYYAEIVTLHYCPFVTYVTARFMV